MIKPLISKPLVIAALMASFVTSTMTYHVCATIYTRNLETVTSEMASHINTLNKELADQTQELDSCIMAIEKQSAEILELKRATDVQKEIALTVSRRAELEIEDRQRKFEVAMLNINTEQNPSECISAERMIDAYLQINQESKND